MNQIPVITIDGPSGTGKGTISQLLAKKLGWHYLDSGVLYRVLAFAALQQNLNLQDESNLALTARTLPLRFVETHEGYKVFLDGRDVSENIRTEECSKTASIVAALPMVREALLERQQAFQLAPGLVTDGRDMGTIVFPNAPIKFFLDASVQERALRRYNQLQVLGISASIDAILAELEVRDQRDRTRAIAPLKPAADAILIDTTGLSIDVVLNQVWLLVSEKFLVSSATK